MNQVIYSPKVGVNRVRGNSESLQLRSLFLPFLIVQLPQMNHLIVITSLSFDS